MRVTILTFQIMFRVYTIKYYYSLHNFDTTTARTSTDIGAGISTGILINFERGWNINIIFECQLGAFFKHNLCVKPYVLRKPRRDPINLRLNKHYQKSNSQPGPSQVGAVTTRPLRHSDGLPYGINRNHLNSWYNSK